jgi:hypothetical protein
MNERQRADHLARAIDELIHGAPPQPQQPEDSETQSLLAVARSRLDSSRSNVNGTVQESVWQRVLDRLDVRPQARREVHREIVADDAMRQTILARREMSDTILDLAEQHRDEVWNRLQQRIGRGVRRATPSQIVSDPDRSRARHFPTGDEDLDGLLTAALNRTTLRDITEREADGKRRLQDRIAKDPARKPGRS